MPRSYRGLALGATLCLAGPAASQRVYPIDMRRLEDIGQFAYLDSIVRGVDVVSLGESLHLTSEFPLVRIGLIRRLDERSGFQLVAMEGSAEDVWIAQDRLLNSPRRDEDITAALRGLFPIWNTNDVRELLAYETKSWSTMHPLYVAAYDIQPGTSRGTHGAAVFTQIAEQLGRYVRAPEGVRPAEVVADLTPLTGSCANYVAHDSARVEHGIAAVTAWANAAAPAVEARFTNVPHAAVLRLIPENLRASHRLCRDRVGQGWGRYKSVRDTNAAQYALALKGVAPNGKLILWAHLSHVSHNTEGRGVSVGQVLRRELGERLYTIMPFAEGGVAPLIFSDVNDDLAYGRVHGANGALGTRLAKLSKTDYFLDLRSAAPDTLFTTPQVLTVEGSPTRLVLARDFDGIVWIKRVHPARFTEAAMPLMLAGLSVLHYRVAFLAFVAAFAAGIVMLVIRRR
jgi:erythromycin esterase-like protein